MFEERTILVRVRVARTVRASVRGRLGITFKGRGILFVVRISVVRVHRPELITRLVRRGALGAISLLLADKTVI